MTTHANVFCRMNEEADLRSHILAVILDKCYMTLIHSVIQLGYFMY